MDAGRQPEHRSGGGPSGMGHTPVQIDDAGPRMTSSAYGLAKEIRLLTAAGWPAASVIARAEARMAWAAFIRELADGNGRRAFEHAEAARRCDNCGYARDYVARPPRRQLGMMSFVDTRGPLHYCDVCAT